MTSRWNLHPPPRSHSVKKCEPPPLRLWCVTLFVNVPWLHVLNRGIFCLPLHLTTKLIRIKFNCTCNECRTIEQELMLWVQPKVHILDNNKICWSLLVKLLAYFLIIKERAVLRLILYGFLKHDINFYLYHLWKSNTSLYRNHQKQPSLSNIQSRLNSPSSICQQSVGTTWALWVKQPRLFQEFWFNQKIYTKK